MTMPRRRGRVNPPLAHRQTATCGGCGKTVVQDNENPQVWFDYNNKTTCALGSNGGRQHKPSKVRV